MEKLIVLKAKELFLSYGWKSISMDDIARSVGISKKTIYQHFEDKNSIIDRVLEEFIGYYHYATVTSKQECRNAIEEVYQYTYSSIKILAASNAGFFSELKKSFPAAWQKILLVKEHSIIPAISRNLERGRNELLYRENLNIPFTSSLRVDHFSAVLNVSSSFLRHKEMLRQMNQLTDFYLHAITTDQGKKLINKYSISKNETSTSK